MTGEAALDRHAAGQDKDVGDQALLDESTRMDTLRAVVLLAVRQNASVASGHAPYKAARTRTQTCSLGRLRSGTGKVVGGGTLTDCFRIPRPDFALYEHKHRITDATTVQYKNVWAWSFQDARRYNRPWSYNHRRGAVIWADHGIQSVAL